MTTVIALRTTENSFILGSDSYCGDDEISLSCGPKFFEDDEIIWGLCGYTLYENELMNAVQNVRESVIWRGDPSKFTIATTVIKKFKSELEKKSLLIDKDGFKEMKSSNFFLSQREKCIILMKICLIGKRQMTLWQLVVVSNLL